MKILFVCRSNVGRSQMAMEFYNQLHPNDAASAGTQVDIPGQPLSDRGFATEVLVVMREIGIDMSKNRRVQLNPEMVKKYDKVIVIAEEQAIPDWLRTENKVEIWDIEDAKNKTTEQARVIRDTIKNKVADLDHRLP